VTPDQSGPPTEFVVTSGEQPYRLRDVVMETWGPAWAYDRVTLMLNAGSGGACADYTRVHGIGDAPAIARKTAVRGAASQWGVWAHQIALGPGAKSALWIHGEDGAVVPNAIVVSGLTVSGAVIQYNAEPGSGGALFRIYKDGALQAELTADGVLRVRKVEVIE
jgi:hypothetical protein